MKPDFDKCEKAATKLLLTQSPSSLPVDVRSLKYNRPILFDTVQNYSIITQSPVLFLPGSSILKDGCMIKARGAHLILYNKSAEKCPERLNWTLAHEVGHILDTKNPNVQNDEIARENREIAADSMAQVLGLGDALASGLYKLLKSGQYPNETDLLRKRICVLKQKLQTP